MKPTYKYLLLFALPFFFIGQWQTVRAQKWQIYKYDETSIIRKVDDTTWLSYSRGKYSYFYLTTTNSTTALCLEFSGMDTSVIVKDFEIFHDSVFFCGKRKLNSGDSAVFGYFPIAGFPTCTVKYYVSGDLASFNNLAIYSMSEHTRVALTASYADGFGTMAEIRNIALGVWECTFVNRNGYDEFFDDVTETSGYVVFSSRYAPSTKYHYTRIWPIQKPAGGSGSLFISPINVKELYKPTLGPVLCQNLELSDLYITVNKTINDTVFLTQFAGLTYYATTYFKSTIPFTLKDIKPNSSSTFYDLLVTTPTTYAVDSYIYHVREDVFYFDSTIDAHYYYNEDINSLCKLSELGESFIASGHNALSFNFRIYKYFKNSWTCAARRGIAAGPKTYYYTQNSINLGETSRNCTIRNIISENYSYTIDRVCP